MTSRRARERAVAVKVKAFADFDFSGPQYQPAQPARNLYRFDVETPVTARKGDGDQLDGVHEIGIRALKALATWYKPAPALWHGDPHTGPEIGHIAARLGLKPYSDDRQALGPALFELRRRGLAHYEYAPVLDRSARWTITDKGLEAVKSK